MLNECQREMMSLPSIGGERCAFCGRRATERHHIVPRSQGGSKGPTVAVCGWGNASGCHGRLHGHTLHLRPDGNGWWEWLHTWRPMKEDRALLMDGWRPVRREMAE